MEVFSLESLTTTNSLSIKAVNNKGQIYILAKCKSNRGNLEIAQIPYEYGMYWYPLPFYFDYHYLTNYKAILLKVDERIAPHNIIEKYNQKNYFLHNFYDYRHDKPGNDLTMYKINLAITTKLKSMGLKTWDQSYNLQDVENNYQLLSHSIEAVENAIIEQEKKHGANPNLVKNNPMNYATDEQSRYLADIGMAYRMLGYQRRVAHTMYDNFNFNDEVL